MKIRSVLASLTGSFVVYMAMVACSSGAHPPGSTASHAAASGSGGTGGRGATSAASTGGAGGTAGASGMGGSGAASDDGGPFDVLTDPTPDAMANQDGARLKAMYDLGDDGSRNYIANQFWDSLLGIRCLYRVASDGVRRCLPNAMEPVDSSDKFYTDAACSAQIIPIGPGSPCGGVPDVLYGKASILPPPECDGPNVYVLAAVPIPPALWHSMDNGITCVAHVPPDPGSAWATVGAYVPPSTFVGSTVTHD